MIPSTPSGKVVVLLHDTTATGSTFSAEQVTYTPLEPESSCPMAPCL